MDDDDSPPPPLPEPLPGNSMEPPRRPPRTAVCADPTDPEDSESKREGKNSPQKETIRISLPPKPTAKEKASPTTDGKVFSRGSSFLWLSCLTLVTLTVLFDLVPVFGEIHAFGGRWSRSLFFVLSFSDFVNRHIFFITTSVVVCLTFAWKQTPYLVEKYGESRVSIVHSILLIVLALSLLFCVYAVFGRPFEHLHVIESSR